MQDDDLILRRLSALTVLTSDEPRAERLRARCRVALERRAPIKRRRVGPTLLAGLGVIYLSALVHDVLLLRSMF